MSTPKKTSPSSHSVNPMPVIGVVALIIVLLVPLVAVVVTQTSGSPANLPASLTPTPMALSTPSDARTAQNVVLSTNKGDIALELFADKAPITVQNFVTLGARGYYNNVTFHRVIAGFMIQGGDPTGTGAGGDSIYGQEFQDEQTGEPIVAGSLAMANAGAGTNGSQFFIVTDSAQPHLDGKHTNFGKVADEASMAVVRAIAAVQVGANDKPVSPVTITGFSITK
jgi:cyclophilin family peptidyl-prolyl cis-trans isomerase